jgi:hypothetical protein
MRAVPSRSARRLPASVLLLLAAACGGAAPAAATASAPAAPAPAPPEPEARDSLLGTWYVLLPELPWTALRLEVHAESHGPRARWISFDWSASDDASNLAGRSKPVAIAMEGDLARLVLDGPAPMLTEAGQPNGQRGAWRVELNTPTEGSAHLIGRAFHTQLTPPAGSPAELTRDFRPAR